MALIAVACSHFCGWGFPEDISIIRPSKFQPLHYDCRRIRIEKLRCLRPRCHLCQLSLVTWLAPKLGQECSSHAWAVFGFWTLQVVFLIQLGIAAAKTHVGDKLDGGAELPNC